MFDLLYVHPRHPLAAQITIYYRLSGIEKSPWPIDAVARLGSNYYDEILSYTSVSTM